MVKWLALYVDCIGKSRAAIVTPKTPDDFPFAVDEFAIGLEDYDGEPVTLVELPDDFSPTVVDVNDDVSLRIDFVDQEAR